MPNQDRNQNNQGSTTASLTNVQTGLQNQVSINNYQDYNNSSDDEKFYSLRGSSAVNKKAIDSLMDGVQNDDMKQQIELNGVSINNPTSGYDQHQITDEDSQLLDQNQTSLNSITNSKKQMRALSSINGAQRLSKQSPKIQAKSGYISNNANNESAQNSSGNNSSDNNTKDDENNTSQQQKQIPKRNKNRKDAYGTRIRKGGRKHKVVFADHKALNQPLYEIHLVESYKKYNTDMSARGENKSCCLIF